MQVGDGPGHRGCVMVRTLKINMKPRSSSRMAQMLLRMHTLGENSIYSDLFHVLSCLSLIHKYFLRALTT